MHVGAIVNSRRDPVNRFGFTTTFTSTRGSTLAYETLIGERSRSDTWRAATISKLCMSAFRAGSLDMDELAAQAINSALSKSL